MAGLRGLYGWLALHCHAARRRLIEADPLTVVVYGDVKPMPVADKRLLLAALRREDTRFSAFRWDARTRHVLGALAAPELQHDFKDILQSPERDDVSQAHADCVLDILIHGEALQGLAPTLLDSHIPILLDGLVDRSEFASHDPYERRLNRMVDALLAHGITVHGDGIADERLCAWLGIGADE